MGINMAIVEKDLANLGNIQKEKRDLFTFAKTTKINNRRYLGNKYKLLPFIKTIVEKECSDIRVVADIFAGTGAVASAFSDKTLITNDSLYSNYLCHLTWFCPLPFSPLKIETLLSFYNQIPSMEDNYMSECFGDTFFDVENCKKIGFIREDIENKARTQQINTRERAILLTSLLYAMDKIANTCGHYDAYRKGGLENKPIELLLPLISDSLNENNQCFHEDANELVKKIEADLVYIDPPYNSRQYCDAYHLLENIARWEKPHVTGVAKKMERTNLKSEYCTNNASTAFGNLINDITARYILVSYNNMANKGNDRSNAKIKEEYILENLSQKGSVKVFKHSYKPFTTGKSDIKNHEERLYLCKCK